jgi:hypothetical protein
MHRHFNWRSPGGFNRSLQVFIDDATGRLLALHSTATETTFSDPEAMRTYLEQHG